MKKLILLMLLPVVLLAQEVRTIPDISSYVVDESGVMTQAEKRQLIDKLSSFEKGSGSQIVVYVTDSVKPEAIEQFSIRAAEKWKVGRKNIDDGVIVIIARQDRRVRIEVGYGLEGAIPDARAKQIIDNDILPPIRKGNFYQGLDQGISRMMQLIDQEKITPVQSPTQSTGIGGWLTGLGVFFLFILGFFLWRKSRKPNDEVKSADYSATRYHEPPPIVTPQYSPQMLKKKATKADIKRTRTQLQGYHDRYMQTGDTVRAERTRSYLDRVEDGVLGYVALRTLEKQFEADPGVGENYHSPEPDFNPGGGNYGGGGASGSWDNDTSAVAASTFVATSGTSEYS